MMGCSAPQTFVSAVYRNFLKTFLMPNWAPRCLSIALWYWYQSGKILILLKQTTFTSLKNWQSYYKTGCSSPCVKNVMLMREPQDTKYWYEQENRNSDFFQKHPNLFCLFLSNKITLRGWLGVSQEDHLCFLHHQNPTWNGLDMAKISIS